MKWLWIAEGFGLYIFFKGMSLYSFYLSLIDELFYQDSGICIRILLGKHPVRQ